MLEFKVPPEYIQIEGLRSVAQDLGLSPDGTREELMQRIRDRVATIPKKPKSKLKGSLAIATAIILILSFAVSAFTTWRDTNAYLKKERQTELSDNQSLIIYDIIEREWVANKFKKGITLADLESKYTNEASRSLRVDYKKEDLQPESVKQTVLNLQGTVKVLKNSSLEYYPFLTAPDSKIAGCAASEAANILFTENGKLTADEFGSKLMERYPIKRDELPEFIASLQNNNVIMLDEEGKVWFNYNRPKDSKEPPRAIPTPTPQKKANEKEPGKNNIDWKENL